MGDRKVILVLSGEICTGKSTLADRLEQVFGFKHCKTKEGLLYLADKKLNGKPPERGFLQKFGEQLDTTGGGKWVLEYFQQLYVKDFDKEKLFVVDSARILKQIQHIRDAYSYFVFHVHLEARRKAWRRDFIKEAR